MVDDPPTGYRLVVGVFSGGLLYIAAAVGGDELFLTDTGEWTVLDDPAPLQVFLWEDGRFVLPEVVRWIRAHGYSVPEPQ